MSNLAIAGILIGVPVAIAGYLGLKHREEKTEATYAAPPPPSFSEQNTVLVPFIQNYDSGFFPSPSEGNMPPSGGYGGPSTIQIKQPVSVKEEPYREILPVSGTTADDYTTANTYELDYAYERFDILAEGGDLLISVRNVNNEWTNDIPVPEGFSSIGFAVTGIKVKSRVPGTTVNYHINLYRW